MPAELTGESAALMDYVSNEDTEIVLRLGKNTIPLVVETIVLADFTECNFAGYEAKEIDEWTVIESESDGVGEVVSDFQEWIAGDVAAPQLVTCAYATIKEGDGPVRLLWCDLFDLPLIVAEEGHMIRKRIRITSLAVDV